MQLTDLVKFPVYSPSGENSTNPLAIRSGVPVWPVKTRAPGVAQTILDWHSEKKVLTTQPLIRGVDIELYRVPRIKAFRRFIRYDDVRNVQTSHWVLALFHRPRLQGTVVGCITFRSNLSLKSKFDSWDDVFPPVIYK